MMPPISPIAINSITPAAGSTAAAGKPGEFAGMLSNAIEAIDQQKAAANQAIQSMLTGGNEELHTVALATTRADLTFELGLQVRNKVLSAYQEVMRMQM